MSVKLIDTDICIEVLRGRPGVVERMAAEMLAGDLRVSAISAFELLFGALKSPRARDELAKVRASWRADRKWRLSMRRTPNARDACAPPSPGAVR